MEWERQSGRFPRDPRLGHRTGCSYVPTKSNTSLLNDLYTSNDGFVSLTSSTHKAVDKNKKLVLILGGSVAMGLGASSNENTICANLQALLDESYPNQYCVINAACAAYCSWQELLRYTLELSDLPLCSVISISSWNDFIHSSIGNRYTGRWTKNHDRSIDDLSDALIGNDGQYTFVQLILQAISQLYVAKKVIQLFSFLRRGQTLTDSEIRWGYHGAKFRFREEAVINYIHNMKQLKAIANTFNAEFFCLVQPYIDTSAEHTSANSSAESDLLRLSRLHSNFFLCRDLFYECLDRIRDSTFMLKSGKFTSNDFVDHCHLNDNGQAKLSQIIFDIISK